METKTELKTASVTSVRVEGVVIRAFRATCMGEHCIVFTTTASKARAATVLQATDAGYKVTFADVKVRRAPEYDGCRTKSDRIPAAGKCFSPEHLVPTV